MSSDVIQKIQVNFFKMTSTVLWPLLVHCSEPVFPAANKASAEVRHVIGSGKVHISLYRSCVTGNGLGILVELCKLQFTQKDSPLQVVFHRLPEGHISPHEFSSENTLHSIQVKTIVLNTCSEYSYLKFVNIYLVKEWK